MTSRLLVAVAAIALVLGAGACHEAAEAQAAPPADDATLPGVDTHDFTPREKHEFSRYVRQFAAPCPSVAVPIAECILEKRACDACLLAASAIAKAVREGMADDQIEDVYKQRFDASSAKVIPLTGSPSRGPEDAPVTIVEFADFECPFCQQMAPKLDSLWEDHRNDLRFVYKFMPLSMHPHGEAAARAAIAAGAQGKFWEMHRLLFANGTRLEDGDLQEYAQKAGLDVARFLADMHAPATDARLEADRKLADDLGVKGTPTIFVNGHEYDSKVDLVEWIDSDLAMAARQGRRAAPPGDAGRAK